MRAFASLRALLQRTLQKLELLYCVWLTKSGSHCAHERRHLPSRRSKSSSLVRLGRSKPHLLDRW